MNEDLILRARVHELGEETLEKARGSFGRGLTGKYSKIPFIGSTLERRAGTMTPEQYKLRRENVRAQDRQIADQQQRTALMDQGINTVNYSGEDLSTATAQGRRLKRGREDTRQLMDAVETNPAMQHRNQLQQQQQQQQQQQGGTETPQTPEMPDTSQQFGGGQGNVTDPNQQPAQMNPTINPQVQGMAQQYQMGQDINTLEAGKKGKETWLRNPDGSMKSGGQLAGSIALGAATGGISNLIGAGMRAIKNRGVDQHNQKFNQAQSRMNMRAMGANPVMKSLSTQHEISAIRRGIRERNTTHNLRR